VDSLDFHTLYIRQTSSHYFLLLFTGRDSPLIGASYYKQLYVFLTFSHTNYLLDNTVTGKGLWFVIYLLH
jgi:hypothetical protein